MAFGEIDPRYHNFWQIVEYRKVFVKKPQDNTIICRLLQGIWLHTQRKEREKLILVYGLSKETVAL